MSDDREIAEILAGNILLNEFGLEPDDHHKKTVNSLTRALTQARESGRREMLARMPREDEVMEAEGIDWDDPLGVYHWLLSRLTKGDK